MQMERWGLGLSEIAGELGGMCPGMQNYYYGHPAYALITRFCSGIHTNIDIATNGNNFGTCQTRP